MTMGRGIPSPTTTRPASPNGSGSSTPISISAVVVHHALCRRRRSASRRFGSTIFRDLNLIAGGGGYAPSGTKTNFAWALHAGASYKVTSNFALDSLPISEFG